MNNILKKRRIWTWIGIFSIIATLRVIASLAISNPIPPADPKVYHMMAVNLVNHGTISLDESAPYRPSGWREPAYIVFLAVCYWLIGINPLGAVVIQSIIGTLGTIFFCLLVLRLEERWKWWLVVLSCITSLLLPRLSSSWVLLMREDFSNMLLLIIMWLTITFVENRKMVLAVLLGLMIGIGILLKVTFAFVAAPTFLLLLILWRFKAIGYILVIFITTTLCVTPWLIRNYLQFGLFSITSTHGLALYLHSGQPGQVEGIEPQYRQIAHDIASHWPDAGPYTLPRRDGLETKSGWCHFCHVFLRLILDQEGCSYEQADEVMFHIAREDVRRDIGRYLRITGLNILYYLTGGLVGGRPEVNIERSTFRTIIHKLIPLSLLFMEILAFIGVYIFRRQPLAWLLLLVALSLIIAPSIVSDSQFRYRSMSDVLFAILALAVVARAANHYWKTHNYAHIFKSLSVI